MMIGENDGYDWIMWRLIFHEGCRLMPYRCTLGKLTIGVGRNLDDNFFSAKELEIVGDWKSGITKSAAMTLLRNDIKKCIHELDAAFAFYQKLDLERQYALLDMCFQLGIGGLKGFKKMLAAIKQGRFKEAGRECLESDYARQTPKRAKRIARVISEGIWLRD